MKGTIASLRPEQGGTRGGESPYRDGPEYRLRSKLPLLGLFTAAFIHCEAGTCVWKI